MLRTITLGCRSLRPKSLNRSPSVWVVSAARSRTACQLPCLHQRSWLSAPHYSTTVSTTNTASTTATHCPGCGAPFQQSQPDQPGYLVTPSDPTSIKKRKPTSGLDHDSYASLVEALDPATRALLEGTSADTINEDDMTTPDTTTTTTTPTSLRPSTPICQRCHQLTHHHTRANEPGNIAFLRSSQQYSSLISFLRTKRQPLLVYVMDATDTPWSIDALQQLAQDNNGARIIVVANKVDLLPSDAIKHHDQRIRHHITQNIKHNLGSQHSHRIKAVHLVSAKKGWGVNHLIKRIQHHMLPTDDVYVVGSVNAGKSALIHQLLNHARTLNKHHYKPTSSSMPGTTLGLVRIPLHILGLATTPPAEGSSSRKINRDHFLIDTPGLIMANTSYKATQQPTQIRPVTFRLHSHQSLLLGHQARIDVLDTDQPILMTLFSFVPPHITKTAKLIDTDMVEQPALVTVDSPHQQQQTNEAWVDLAFAGGIGWVALTGAFGRASLRVWLDPALPASAFALRDPPFLPFEFRGQVRKFFGSGDRAIQ